MQSRRDATGSLTSSHEAERADNSCSRGDGSPPAVSFEKKCVASWRSRWKEDCGEAIDDPKFERRQG